MRLAFAKFTASALLLCAGLGGWDAESAPITDGANVVIVKIGNFTYEPSGPPKQRSQRRTLFRKVGVIHEDARYEAVMRNLSKTGAMIEGLLDVPVGTVGTVRRSQDATQGIEFETPLISDGAEGLCTRHRISPYALAAAGMPLQALPPGHYAPSVRAAGEASRPQFLQLDLSVPTSSRAA